MNIAIITGASSGLGAAYAWLLAEKDGIDEIWLIARRRERLEKLARSLALPCRLLTLDLTQEDNLQQIARRLETMKDPHIAWLIQAAGFGCIGSCENVGPARTGRMIDLNCRAAAVLTEICLPYMQKGSHIMEICSCAAFQPIPYLTAYAATKAFLLRYSRGLREELRPCGIIVTAVCPYWIRDTEFIGLAKKTDTAGNFAHFLFASTCQTVARRSLQAAEKNHAVCTPGLIATLDRLFGAIVPDGIILSLLNIYRKL